MKILIAEDDPVASKVLHLTLELLGHEVITARNGADAWQLFDREPVRIVVSDWMMPEMDGLELCFKVRERPKTDYTYFILLTAIGTEKDRYLEAMDAGIDDFLTKPLDRERIMTRLRAAERILGFTTQIRLLQDLLPICSYCHKIRDDADYWQQLEQYIHTHTGSRFSHGICPECFEKQMSIMQTENAAQQTGSP